MITIRPEKQTDYAAIRLINEAAFVDSAEADLIERVRSAEAILISLVASKDAEIIAHILFSPVTIHDGAKITPSVGLAPVAVHPDHQQQGIGNQLIRAGITACRAANYPHIFLLGHASYYPRFGFQRSDKFGIHYEHPVSPTAFMCLELHPHALADVQGIVRYHAAFAGV